MAAITQKTALRMVNGTPKKRFILSIISDYDLRTGLCELVDNALDPWIAANKKFSLKISIVLDPNRQFIQVSDNAGGVKEDQADLLVAPGASRNETSDALIGIFGVGSKRAAIALGELVEIRTRHKKEKTIQIDLTKEWIELPSWDLEIYQIPDIAPGTTTVEISKVRQTFDLNDIENFRQHLAETYSWFIGQGCVIELNGKAVVPIAFDSWAYPADFRPRRAKFKIEPADSQFLEVTLTGGLIRDRNPETENYGVYFFCNERLILKELKSRDVGYVSGEAGVPHPDASLSRVLIEYRGPAELMPWNSSKSGINFSHPAFTELRQRIIDFSSYYSTVSRRLKADWNGSVFKHTKGTIEDVPATEATSGKKKVLPKPPKARSPSRYEILKEKNKKLITDQPWTLGLLEAMGVVDLVERQKYETKNRVALILLDSNFEIALKEFIVNRKDLFPAHTYTNGRLATIFQRRTEVIREVTAHVSLSATLLGKVSHYYELRNNLTHQRATTLVTDRQIDDYRKTVEAVLKTLFGFKFPA